MAQNTAPPSTTATPTSPIPSTGTSAERSYEQCLESFGAALTIADTVGVVGIVSSFGGFAFNAAGLGPAAVQKLADRTATNLTATLAPDAARAGIRASEITISVTRQEAGALVQLLSKAKNVAAVAGSLAKFSGYLTVAGTAASLGMRGYCLAVAE